MKQGKKPFAQVIDLGTIRARLGPPTRLLAYLAQYLGTTVLRVRYPGYLEARFPDGEVAMTVRVHVVDIEEDREEARRLAERPLPEDLFLNIHRETPRSS